MGSYLIRRLLIMIPTLFGITIVSFCVMQLAPGDPVLNQLNSGNAGQSGETPEAYLQRKRDLHLDKPLVLNFNSFRDFSLPLRCALLGFLSLSPQRFGRPGNLNKTRRH